MVITVSCPACETSFPVDPNKIPEAGVKVRCSQCAQVFRVERPVAEEPVETASAAAAAPPAMPEAAEPAEPEASPEPEAAEDEWAIERDAFEKADAELPAPEPAPEEVPDGGAELPDWAVSGGAGTPLEEAASEAEPLPEPEDPALDAQIQDWAAEPPEPAPADVVTDEPDMPGLSEIGIEPLPEPEPTAEPDSVPELEQPAAEVDGPTPAEDEPVKGFTFGKRDPMDKARRLARVLVSDMVMYNAERHQQALSRGTLAEDFEEEIEKSWKEYVEQLGNDIADGEGQRFWRQALNDILAKGEQVF